MGSWMEVRKSKLTETAVAALKPAAKEYEVHDAGRSACGAPAARVDPHGVQTFRSCSSAASSQAA